MCAESVDLALRKSGHPPTPLHVRFWAKVERTDDHWLWHGATNDDGYGVILGPDSVHLVYAHRISYELHGFAIGEGQTLDHTCRVRSCVRPEHLEPVSKRENILRGFEARSGFDPRTHCINGHPFDEANTYRTPKGGRQCRICTRASAARHRARKRAAA